MEYFKLNSVEYQMIYSVTIFPNIILPLFSGIYIDKITPKRAMFDSLIVITIS